MLQSCPAIELLPDPTDMGSLAVSYGELVAQYGDCAGRHNALGRYYAP